MSMQAVMSPGDPRLYNVNRDIVHNWVSVLNHIAGIVDDKRWKELQQLLDEGNVSDEEVGHALSMFMLYTSSAADKDKVDMTMEAVLKASGFLDCKPLAQVAVMALIGQAYAGIQYVGIREASLGTDKPLLEVKDLIKAANQQRGRKASLWYKLYRVVKEHFK